MRRALGATAVGMMTLLFVSGVAVAPVNAQEPAVTVEAACLTTQGGAPVARFDVFPQALEEFEFPLGADNAFSPAPADRGQPTRFGPTPGSVGIPFDPAVDPPLTWQLGSALATATADLPACEDNLLPDGIPVLDTVVSAELRQSILEHYVALGRIAEPFARGPRGAEGPIGESGSEGPTGPAGNPGDPGVVIVRERISAPTAAGASTASATGGLSATCPDTTLAVAGGADPGEGSVDLVGSSSTADGGGWVVTFSGPLDGAVDVYAVCLAATSASVMPPGPVPDPDDPDDDERSDPEEPGAEEPTEPGREGDGSSAGGVSTEASEQEAARRGALARTGWSILLLAVVGTGCLAVGTAIHRRRSVKGCP